MEDDEETGINIVDIAINCTLDCLVNLGILVELEGSVGYNGITLPSGVSNQTLEIEVSDKIAEHMSKFISVEV